MIGDGMKNKGFTLIELLAIIVILAIIAVITIPQIMNVVDDSKKSATKDSAYGYKNAVHQYYLTNSSNDDEFDLNGSYDVIDGTLSDGLNSYNISLTGDVPKSGSVTIEDGEIVEGCIDYGKYSVVIENGNVAEASVGACYNISYFTYDENATAEEYGSITSKSSSPNPSWTYYVKEYESSNRYRYGVWNKEDEEFDSHLSFLSLDSCQSFLNENLDEEELEYAECRNKETYKKYQICGVSSGKTFCLKLGKNEYNISLLDDVFDSCEVGSAGGNETAGGNRAAGDLVEIPLYTCDAGGISVSLYRSIIRINNCAIGITDNDEYEQYQGFQCAGGYGIQR